MESNLKYANLLTMLMVEDDANEAGITFFDSERDCYVYIASEDWCNSLEDTYDEEVIFYREIRERWNAHPDLVKALKDCVDALNWKNVDRKGLEAPAYNNAQAVLAKIKEGK